ncbi:MAG: YbhB/YbcL family Raf kinase inhibitor-like protein, partial [Giesbergeria sp.]
MAHPDITTSNRERENQMKTFRALLGMGALLSLAACGGGSDPDYTSTPTVPLLVISSSSYADGGVIDRKYASVTQGGLNTSPQLRIESLPPGTAALAIVMDDETAPCGKTDEACVHWNVFNLPANEQNIAENANLAAIPGVIMGSTYNGQTGYQGPNPAMGKHFYRVTVYAMKAGIAATAATPRYTSSQFEAAYAGLIMQSVSWTG